MDERDRITLEVVRAELNGKLDLLLERTAEAKADLSDHESRLRNVEKWKYAIPISALLALMTALAYTFGIRV